MFTKNPQLVLEKKYIFGKLLTEGRRTDERPSHKLVWPLAGTAKTKDESIQTHIIKLSLISNEMLSEHSTSIMTVNNGNSTSANTYCVIYQCNKNVAFNWSW